MPDPDSILPFSQLPQGFAEGLDRPVETPATPRPAATVVLLRDAPSGPEALLLKRVRSAGFVPGAFVFPGGRVDDEDGAARVVERVRGIQPGEVAERLRLPPDSSPPPIAYLVAALREAWEETGILLGRASGADVLELERARLLAGETDFGAVLEAHGIELDGGSVQYIAHWITPEIEPRRYDTRFFAGVVAADEAVVLNEAELSEALWLTPDAALSRHRAGSLPMVFPTLKTLDALRGFDSAAGALASFAARDIPAILPRLVRTPTGVGLEIGEP